MYNLRPQNFNEFKGQKLIIDNIKIFITSSINNNHQLDHILLHGIPGTGKTSLAFIIANELNKKLKIIQGTQIKKVTDLINFLSLLCEGDIVFIDEIHAISIDCLETLYSVLEDNAIDIKIGKDNNSKFMRINIPKFTLIGATTSISKIPKPLEERFAINFFIDLYSNEELFEIIKQSIIKMEISLNDEEIKKIAIYSKGVPRIANNLIKRVYDYKLLDKHLKVEEIFLKMGLYNFGLNKLDLKYLKVINDNVFGIKTISNILEIDIPTIENKIEPYLLKNNFIVKTSKGRKITQFGKEQLLKIKEGL